MVLFQGAPCLHPIDRFLSPDFFPEPEALAIVCPLLCQCLWTRATLQGWALDVGPGSFEPRGRCFLGLAGLAARLPLQLSPVHLGPECESCERLVRLACSQAATGPFEHLSLDVANGRLYGNAEKLMALPDDSPKIYFSGAVSINKVEGKSFGIMELRVAETISFPIYVQMADLGSLKSDPESCVSPAWCARGVSTEAPTCEVLWDSVVQALKHSLLLAAIGHDNGLSLALPYLNPKKDVISSMVDASDIQTKRSSDGKSMVELTRPAVNAVRTGGRGKSKKNAGFNEFFGSCGMSVDYDASQDSKNDEEEEDLRWDQQ